MLTEEPWLDPERLMILRPSGREWRNCVESAIGHWRGRTLDRPSTGPELAGRITKTSVGSSVQFFFGSSFASYRAGSIDWCALLLEHSGLYRFGLSGLRFWLHLSLKSKLALVFPFGLNASSRAT
jgi:hypothetical protein